MIMTEEHSTITNAPVPELTLTPNMADEAVIVT